MGDLRTAGGLLSIMAELGIGPGTALALAEHFETFDQLTASSPVELERFGAPVAPVP